MTADRRTRSSWLISALCLAVLACIWTVGLWPFHVPDNAVNWLKSEDGVRFGKHAAIVSATTFKAKQSATDDGISLELWLQPANERGAILAFDSSSDPRSPFLLRQNGAQLTLQRYVVDGEQRVSHPLFTVENVFQFDKRVFLTITSSSDGVRCYVNGVLAKDSADPRIAKRELSGRLIVGNSTWSDEWSGDLTGLAIYDRQLNNSEVKSHFDQWTRGQGRSLAADGSLAALYTFSERQGNSVRNQVDATIPLIIPAKFFVLHKSFLASTARDYKNFRDVSNRMSIVRSLAENVVGFVPVGFVLMAFFTSVKRIQHPAITVIVLGFLISFSIEALQWFLPNRDSGMTDLFTNTGGTALGVLVYKWPTAHRIWAKLNLAGPSEQADPEAK